jgi:putative aldouronate transport system permease protein
MVEIRSIKRPTADKVFDFFVFVIVTGFLIVVAYPLWWVICCSVSQPAVVFSGRVFLWPLGFFFDNYIAVFRSSDLWRGYANSTMYMLTGSVVGVTATALAAFPLSRKEYPFRSLLTAIMTFTMFFGGGLIPYYFLLRDLHFVNSFWVMVIPGMISAWGVIIMRTFYQSNVPEELCDSARIDGCDYFRLFRYVYIPLSLPIFAVNFLFFAVGIWNNYFTALIFLTKPNIQPLTLLLRNMLVSDQFRLVELTRTGQFEEARVLAIKLEAAKFPTIVLASLPMIMLYPFVQKYFVKGILIGSIKG